MCVRIWRQELADLACPQCGSEMSKKWRARSSTNTKSSAAVWACGVCGCQLTKAEIELSAKESTEPHASLSSV